MEWYNFLTSKFGKGNFSIVRNFAITKIPTSVMKKHTNKNFNGKIFIWHSPSKIYGMFTVQYEKALHMLEQFPENDDELLTVLHDLQDTQKRII